MLVPLCLFACVALSEPVQAPLTEASRARLDQAFLITSISASAVASSLTAACTSTGECREVNPVMAKLIGDSVTKAVVFKAAIGGTAHFLVWRFMKGKWRTGALVMLAAINVADALHDIRVMRDIQQRRR